MDGLQPNGAFKVSGDFIKSEWFTEKPPELEFCVKPLVPIGAVTLMVGHGGTGKSLLSLKMAIHICLGLDILGAKTNGANVAYMSLEDPEVILRERIYKIAQDEEIKSRIEELLTKLMIIDRYGIQTHMIVDAHNCSFSPLVPSLASLLRDNSIKCLFVDTFVRTNNLNENDNTQMGNLLVAFEQVAKDAGCAVILIHHIPKNNSSTKSSYAPRGASSITDNARALLFLEKVSKKDEEEGNKVRITHKKHNYSAKHPDQYIEISKDGIPVEIKSSIKPSNRNDMRERYAELYAHYVDNSFEHITKNKIDDVFAKSIRVKGVNYGKITYRRALDWGIKEGYVVEVDNTKKGDYYTLNPLPDNIPE